MSQEAVNRLEIEHIMFLYLQQQQQLKQQQQLGSDRKECRF